MTAFAYDGFDKTIGLVIDEASGEQVRAHLTVTPALLQPYGLLHGGVLCSVVETLGSVGGALWFGDRGNVVGVANHTNFLRSAREGDELTAVATPVHQGRTQQLWTVDITNAEGKLVVKGELRVANLAQSGPTG